MSIPLRPTPPAAPNRSQARGASPTCAHTRSAKRPHDAQSPKKSSACPSAYRPTACARLPPRATDASPTGARTDLTGGRVQGDHDAKPARRKLNHPSHHTPAPAGTSAAHPQRPGPLRRRAERPPGVPDQSRPASRHAAEALNNHPSQQPRHARRLRRDQIPGGKVRSCVRPARTKPVPAARKPKCPRGRRPATQVIPGRRPATQRPSRAQARDSIKHRAQLGDSTSRTSRPRRPTSARAARTPRARGACSTAPDTEAR